MQGSNLAAITKTGVTAIDAIFAHIPLPLTFLTDIMDSCVQTTNSCLVEKHDTVRIPLKSQFLSPGAFLRES